MSTQSPDAIPVLTQVIDLLPPPPSEAHPSGLAAAASPESAKAEWANIERTINDRVLLQLQGRIDFMLEHRLKESLDEAMQKVTQDLVRGIRQRLESALKDVIAHAVAQEVARMQASE